MTQARRYRSQWVEVTQEDIEKAVQGDSRNCAVALAIHRLKPEARQIKVDISTIRYSNPKQRKRYIFITPHRVQDYIAAFDAGKHNIAPFNFAMPHEAFVHPMSKTTTIATAARSKSIKAKTAAKVKTASKVKVVPKGPSKQYVVEGRKAPPRSKGAKEYRLFGRRVLRENWPQHAHGVMVP